MPTTTTSGLTGGFEGSRARAGPACAADRRDPETPGPPLPFPRGPGDLDFFLLKRESPLRRSWKTQSSIVPSAPPGHSR
jgi:hypothetical protein